MDSTTIEKGPERMGEMEANGGETPALVEYDAAADARVRWKLDTNMMPLFFVLCEHGRTPPLDLSSQTC
jgi:hypothetical protein